MTEIGSDSKLFEVLARTLLARGAAVRFCARGASMSPAICDGEMVEITPVIVSKLRKDDIVLAKSKNGFRLHRIVLADAANNAFMTRGDCGQQDDPPLSGDQILGIARAKEVRIGRSLVKAKFRGVGGRILRSAARAQRVARRFFSSSDRLSVTGILMITAMLALARPGQAQVLVDATTSGTSQLTGTGNFTFNHTTTATTNRLLVVGVSMNVSNSNGATVSGVTYNGSALARIGFHNDTGNSRRVEMWYLLNPASGTNLPIKVSVTVAAGRTVGVVAGATTFTGVDQTTPLGTFVSADGAGAGNSQLDVPSVVNGMVIDTLAIGGNLTITVPGWQTSQWNRTTGTGNTDVTASGSTRAGAPSLPFSETFGTSNWSLGAVSINPTTADISVSTSVSAVAFGQNSTYTVTVTNNGPSPANNVTLLDTFSDPNLSLVSQTSTSGTNCSVINGNTQISCTLPTSLAKGATATLTVVVSTSAAGYYPNTAMISDSGTPPDPNTGNNTYVAVAPVLSTICSDTSPPAGGTLTGTINTYYPGTASIPPGSTSIPVGTANGSGTIAAGSLLLVMQMQDASISTTNTVAYGNGYTGTGFTAVNNAGNYEFVTATGPISGGLVPITGAGSSGGLVFGYTAAAASGAKGASTYQVVLVPQYASATLGAVTAAAWNGSTGGILALDVAGALNLGGATVSVNGTGFRGGAGMQLTGGTGANTDFWQTSPSGYVGTAVAGIDAPKGEGVAGTPMWVESGSSYLQTTNAVGYPSGFSGLDGSMGRGAPANAGGGGTDADPAANDENAGGGGGSNGGSGGFGGNSWNSNLAIGGEGGSPFPATIDRIAMGGGGGAGTRNNSGNDNQASAGATGGGIIFIRAGSLTGTATLTANGANAYNATANDAGGGGGAGGTIVVLSRAGGEGGLTLQANGGTGGNAWHSQAYSLADRHGPGGGGGGGTIFVSGTPASVSVNGGANGTTLNPGVAYGATSGTAGTSATNATLAQVTGIQSAAVCATLADLKIAKIHSGTTLTRGLTATYTITVQNVSTTAASGGTVTVTDVVPTGLTPTGASGTNWTCSVSGQIVSCSRSDSLAIGASYPAITVTANVLQSAPATLVNTAVVTGGGAVDPLKNASTDTASVISSADLQVTDAASPNPVAAGSNITYTQTVTNIGPSAADNATFVANIPANTTFVSMTAPAGWSCIAPAVGGTGTVTCTNVNMGTTSAPFTMVVQVNAGTANGTVITGIATASSSVTDPTSSNNTATVTTVVGTTSNAELTVTNSGAPNPVQVGSNVTFTQTVTNTGSSAATGATFTETTPANTTFVSITPPAGWNCAGFPPLCTAASVAAGASGSFSVVYKVNGGTLITDTVRVNATNQAFGINTATATVVVGAATSADIALSTAASPGSVFPGNGITYTQTVTNNGPAAASGVSFTEAIPANTTFQSVLPPAGWTCTTPAVGGTGNIVCSDSSTLASGTAAAIIVVVNVPSTVAAGTITANSSVTATTTDPTSGNNSTVVTTSVGAVCDLSVTNSGSPNPVAVGSTITYTQTVTNIGPSNCAAATFSEPTPANTSFVSVSVANAGGAGWACSPTGPVSCSSSTVPPGASATVTAVYTVTGGTTITDTATVGSSTHDTNTTNNSATSTTTVASSSQADLSITNSANPTTLPVGSNITYTQIVNNAGPEVAASAVISETLPANTTFVSLSGPAGWTCTTSAPYRCSDTANLAVNSPATFTFVVSVTGGTTISDTAQVSATTTDPNAANNSATATVTVGNAADLSVTNSASPNPVAAGTNITYTQVVNNAGPSTATTVTLTETLPANTTPVSLTGPVGWTCNLGTLTCTDTSLAANASATISFVVNVKLATAEGTQISDTVSVQSAVTDPHTADNSAIATDTVGVISHADMAIVKTASPNPVTQGTPLTYSLAITNNGPGSATNVTVTDTLPSSVTYLSATTTVGSCSEAGGTVSCLLGTMPNGGTATVKILTVPDQAGIVSNTATVSADQTDPTPTNNSSTQSETVAAPTKISLQSFTAQFGRNANGTSAVILLWKTGGEAHNLGFNLYREQNGSLVRVNSSLIAGSALLMKGAQEKHAGRTYRFIDPGPSANAYWLEDVDVNGIRSMHGPVLVQTSKSSGSSVPAPQARMLSQLNQQQRNSPIKDLRHRFGVLPDPSAPTSYQVRKQFELASRPAVKISVEQEGWYRVAQPDLVSAGLDPNVDPVSLHLYAEAVEQPIQITGATSGPGGFGPQAAISFYGTGIDTVFTGTRVYWLVSEPAPGMRIPTLAAASGSGLPPQSFLSTVELRQHTIYFAALLTKDGNNYFGSLISPTPVDQLLNLPHLDTASTQPAQVEVDLQGVIVGYPHDVEVMLNGSPIGNVTFTGQDQGHLSVTVSPTLLREGLNTVTLAAQNGDYDTSLVQSIRITYPELYVADSDQLIFTGRSGDEIMLSGFTSAPTVLDITNPAHPILVFGEISSNESQFSVALQVPWTRTSFQASPVHTLLALGSDRISSPVSLSQHMPSRWHAPQRGADIVMVTYGDFAASLAPLVQAHQGEGKSSVIVPISDLYDEFNFGEHSPWAIREFLQMASKYWKNRPAYLMLNGRASSDPRNYLGMGDLDLVPTAIVPAGGLMTASDDWFSDFSDTGLPSIATGRLPVSTKNEASTVVAKIAGYESSNASGGWTSQVLMVADSDDTESFSQDSTSVQAELPNSIQATQILAGSSTTAAVRQDIVDKINAGQVLVNYVGHGSEEQWSGSDIFDTSAASGLTNGSQLPVFLIMDCLNGFFQDVYSQSLGVTLLLAPNGGAVGVLASSGLNQPAPQTMLDQVVVQGLTNPPVLTLGDSIVKAKAQITDNDVRKTFLLFGDPAMKLKTSPATQQ